MVNRKAKSEARLVIAILLSVVLFIIVAALTGCVGGLQRNVQEVEVYALALPFGINVGGVKVYNEQNFRKENVYEKSLSRGHPSDSRRGRL